MEHLKNLIGDGDLNSNYVDPVRPFHTFQAPCNNETRGLTGLINLHPRSNSYRQIYITSSCYSESFFKILPNYCGIFSQCKQSSLVSLFSIAGAPCNQCIDGRGSLRYPQLRLPALAWHRAFVRTYCKISRWQKFHRQRHSNEWHGITLPSLPWHKHPN